MPKPLEGPLRAKHRVDIFPHEYVAKNPEGRPHEANDAYIKHRGYMELLLELMKAGLSTALAVFFTQLVWRAGSTLDRQVGGSLLAKDTGKLRSVVSRSLRQLQEIGVIEKIEPAMTPPQWKFPVYDELVARVTASSEKKG